MTCVSCFSNRPFTDSKNTPVSEDATYSGETSPNSTAVSGGTVVSVGDCDSEMNDFTAKVWLPIAGVDCLACHVTNGMAPQAGAHFMLAHPSQPNYLASNLAAIRAMAAADANGMPHILAKATNSTPHGGGQRFAVGSGPYLAMEAFLKTTQFATGCDDAITPQKLQSVVMLSNTDTLRKAALQLAQRLPTKAELNLVGSGNLDAAITSLLASPGFGDFVLRSLDDTYLSVSSNVNNQGIDIYSYNNNIAPDYCASAPLSNGQPVYRGCQVYWYANNAPSGAPGIDDHDTTQRALSEAGLRLVQYLAVTGRDYRDILNANYMLLNPWSARSLSNDFGYNLLHQVTWKNINDPNEFQPVVMNKPKWPTVGLLTDSAFLTHFSTTSTNRNRKRAHFIYQYFLGMDILTLSQRPSNLNALLATAAADPNALPPFMSNGLCTDCHSLIDPMAGNFAGYNDGVDFSTIEDSPQGPFGSYKMFPAGFEGVARPANAVDSGPRWLAEKITDDPRFARAMVTWWYTILTSQKPLGDAPSTTKDLGAFLAAQRYQDAVFTGITEDFVASGYNIQVVIRELIESTYYRSKDLSQGLSTGDFTMLDTLVGYRWTGPDMLNTKLLATTGTTWLSDGCQFNGWGCLNQPLVREYEGLLGGIDPINNVTLPNDSATGMMVRISTTMATQVACKLVPQEFNNKVAARVLMGSMDPSILPDTPAHVAAIQQTIATMYEQVTGAAPQDIQANLSDAYTLFTSSLSAAKTAGDASLANACHVGSITSDPTYTIKSWITVMAYILSDPRLVQE